MRRSRLVGAVLIFLVGLIFFGQGIGLIGGSGMTGSSFWAAVGVIAVVASLGLLVNERRRAARA